MPNLLLSSSDWGRPVALWLPVVHARRALGWLKGGWVLAKPSLRQADTFAGGGNSGDRGFGLVILHNAVTREESPISNEKAQRRAKST